MFVFFFTSQFLSDSSYHQSALSPDLSGCFVHRVSDLGGKLRNGVEHQAVQHRLHTQRSRGWTPGGQEGGFLPAALTSSRFHVRRLSALGSRLSGARGRSSAGLPFISGGFVVGIAGGIFLKFRLSSNTRSTNWREKKQEKTRYKT